MRVALVTGGGTGIGRASALALADAGWSVVVSGRRSEPLQQLVDSLGTDTGFFVEGDVTRPDDAERMVAGAMSRFGGLDLLVNNAGFATPGKLRDVSVDDILQMVNINLTGTLLVTRSAIPALIKRRGRIINIGSVGGLGASRLSTAYGAAKAGVHHATVCLARELAADGIAVNSVIPGPVQTDIIAHDTLEALAQSTLSGRIGQPEDVARWVVALSEEDADWVTGAQFTIDGGFSVGT